MKQIINSATRITLIMLMIVLCVCVLLVVANNVTSDNVVLGIVGVFTNSIVAVLSFYFGQKSTDRNTGKDEK